MNNNKVASHCSFPLSVQIAFAYWPPRPKQSHRNCIIYNTALPVTQLYSYLALMFLINPFLFICVLSQVCGFASFSTCLVSLAVGWCLSPSAATWHLPDSTFFLPEFSLVFHLALICLAIGQSSFFINQW